MMLYTKELLEYMKHFPLIQFWIDNPVTKNEIVNISPNVMYDDVSYLIEDSANNDKLYEIQTSLKDVQYIDKSGEIQNAFGVAIDVDTKDRDGGVTVENLKNGKNISRMIVENLANHSIKTLMKFSGGGYHIIAIFDI